MNEKDTSLEGWVCPFCGPNARATFQETCAECNANLGDDESWFMQRIRELEQRLLEAEPILTAVRVAQTHDEADPTDPWATLQGMRLPQRRTS